MQRSVGVIAEYNPFHNGHACHLARAKELSGCAHAVVAMGGSFVQRGDAAAFDKFARAEWALSHGASLVLELPTVFACASAERFAEGGTALLAATGLVSVLAFGAEDADAARLSAIAAASAEESPAFRENLARHLKSGLPFPAARAKALGETAGGDADMLKAPNNILAIEYIKALHAIAPGIAPLPIPRAGTGHDAPGADSHGGFASAFALRDAAARKDFPFIRAATPAAGAIEAAILSGAAPAGSGRLSDVILYALRRLSVQELAALPDVAEGLQNVLYEAARAASDYPAFLAAVKTKRYTLARLRRIAIYALLGVDKAFFARHSAPRYLRVLGVRRDALPLLSALSGKASLPVVTGYQSYASLDAAAKEQFDLDLFAGELRAMAAPVPAAVRSEFSRPLLIV